MYILPAHISHGTQNVPALNLPDSLCPMADEHKKAQAIVSCHAAESRYISTKGFSAEFIPDSKPTVDCTSECDRYQHGEKWQNPYSTENSPTRQINYKIIPF